MRTFWRWVGRLAVTLPAFAFFPSLSVALDCSYNNAFNPPLPVSGASCLASQSLAPHGLVSNGLVEIPVDAPLEVQAGISWRLHNLGPSRGSLIIDPNASLTSGGSVLNNPVGIEATHNFISNGHLQLDAPEQILRLRGATSLQLLGQGTTGNTEITADSLTLESSKGDISLDGVSLSAQYVLQINATKGHITITNSTLSVQTRAGVGPCRIYAKYPIQGLDDPSNHLDCIVITHTPK